VTRLGRSLDKRITNCNESGSGFARLYHGFMRIIRVRSKRPALDRIEIVQGYVQYEPQIDVRKMVRKALRIIPDHYLRGINCIVLTNSKALSRRQRRRALRSRKRSVPMSRVYGLYYPCHGRRGEIVLFVDRIIGKLRKRPILLRQEIAFHSLSRVLFHEVGHHIDFTKQPSFGERETTAERYESEYQSQLFKSRLGFIFIAIVAACVRGTTWVLSHPVKTVEGFEFLWCMYSIRKQRRKRLEAYANA